MKTYLLFLVALIACSGCNKFLEEKPRQKLATISTKDDLWALLNNENIFNAMSLVGEDLSDNYYLTDNTWNSIANISIRNKYGWEVSANDDVAWSMLYHRVYYANVVLESVGVIRDKLSDADYREIGAIAKFYRSLSFFELMNLFSLPYNGQSNGDKPGIPLRTSSDINVKFKRSTISECYEQIIGDLEDCMEDLPLLAQIKTRPSRLAVWALLARVYLSIGNYDRAFEYSRLVIEKKPELLNYAIIDEKKENPFGRYNAEVIHSTSNYSQLLTRQNCYVDTVLYAGYSDGDCRKKLFFVKEGEKKVKFRGSFAEDNDIQFTGSTIGEMYLTFAEASLKILDKKGDVIEKLNYFLKSRYETGKCPDIPSGDEELIDFILSERRKELVFRNRRYEDVRRLNLEGYNITFTRKLAGREYLLKPNALAYALLIPLEAINYSGIIQNSR
ncbi:RagB/SusD family nutrient uptake outer membrane protein [Sphingobacterium athyrii]|uniref:Uncharacterized protein n=1 Tax=Sphingobacterium athyrii TaxID=2152717 RepID=A0A363NPQ5_9SPHI|nr:RagB/SusD family nutrient uptake outer membrane protein [Sphingobacterium athyrii]PUV22700.1 hypothetical protein DCO56_21125 [Sphingobacterium athyrii]